MQCLRHDPKLVSVLILATPHTHTPLFFERGEIPRLDFIKIRTKVRDTKHKSGANRSTDKLEESEDLPLCSPCRGIYVLDRALLEVDLWVKKEEEGSTDERLLSEYVEICLRSSFNKMRTGRIHSEDAILDMDFMFLSESVEAVIEVFTGVDSPQHVRFIASSSCFDKEILLFEGKCFQGKLFTHVVAVTVEEKLSIRLEWENPHLEWTFQDGVVGALSYPDDDYRQKILGSPLRGILRR